MIPVVTGYWIVAFSQVISFAKAKQYHHKNLTLNLQWRVGFLIKALFL
jgi:hypothetical protein